MLKMNPQNIEIQRDRWLKGLMLLAVDHMKIFFLNFRRLFIKFSSDIEFYFCTY